MIHPLYDSQSFPPSFLTWCSVPKEKQRPVRATQHYDEVRVPFTRLNLQVVKSKNCEVNPTSLQCNLPTLAT